jgi:hypothetical protein
MISAKRKTAGDELAGVVGRKIAVKLEGVIREFDGGFEGKAVRAGHSEAQFSGVALR